MKRDLGLIRQILMAAPVRPTITNGYDNLMVNRHIEMLTKVGLLSERRDLTKDGHDLLVVLKNESLWNKLTDSLSLSELAAMPSEVIKNVGTRLDELDRRPGYRRAGGAAGRWRR